MTSTHIPADPEQLGDNPRLILIRSQQSQRVKVSLIRGGRRNGIKLLPDQRYQGEGLADGVTNMSNDTIHWEARYLPAGPPRLLGWNVPAEELVHIPEHWLVHPEPNPSLHYLLALLYILFTFLALLGNGLVIWIFCA